MMRLDSPWFDSVLKMEFTPGSVSAAPSLLLRPDGSIDSGERELLSGNFYEREWYAIGSIDPSSNHSIHISMVDIEEELERYKAKIPNVT